MNMMIPFLITLGALLLTFFINYRLRSTVTLLEGATQALAQKLEESDFDAKIALFNIPGNILTALKVCEMAVDELDRNMARTLIKEFVVVEEALFEELCEDALDSEATNKVLTDIETKAADKFEELLEAVEWTPEN